MFRNVLHGGVEFNGVFANAGLAAARVCAGLMMAFGHGLGKLPPSDQFIDGVAGMGFPMPLVFAWLAALAEFAGALALTIGLATRPAALFLGITMATAAFVAHAQDPFDVKERALLYLAISAIFLAMGSGRYGLDQRLRA